jgi:tetratricopeptide (TPR) repeat protein
MEVIPFSTRVKHFLGRFRRLPTKFWAVLATVFGIADFLTWSIFANIEPEMRWRLTLAIVVFSLFLTLVVVLRVPTEDETLTNARLMTRAARQLYNSKDYEEALVMLQRSAQIDPDSTTTLGLLGRTLVRLGHFSEAIPYLSKAIRQTVIEGNRRILRSNRAIAHIMLGEYGHALDDLEDNVRENPDTRSSGRLRVLVWLYLGRLDNALREIEITLEKHPDYLCGHATKAVILHKLGQVQDAVEEIAVCESMVPEDADDFYCLAFAYAHLRTPEEALNALRIAVERDSKYRARATGDPLFAELREYPGFAKAVGNLETKPASRQDATVAISSQ